jgi:hypothetical protein
VLSVPKPFAVWPRSEKAGRLDAVALGYWHRPSVQTRPWTHSAFVLQGGTHWPPEQMLSGVQSASMAHGHMSIVPAVAMTSLLVTAAQTGVHASSPVGHLSETQSRAAPGVDTPSQKHCQQPQSLGREQD